MTRSGASTYDDDFYAWTQEQAAALRTAKGFDHGVDIEHVAEEIEDLGKRDLREVKSFVRRFFEHLMKIDALPDAREVLHWRSEARHFRRSARSAFSPSMRRLIDLEALWREGAKYVADDLADFGAKGAEVGDCPFTLDMVLSEDLDVDAALAELDAAKAAARR